MYAVVGFLLVSKREWKSRCHFTKCLALETKDSPYPKEIRAVSIFQLEKVTEFLMEEY